MHPTSYPNNGFATGAHIAFRRPSAPSSIPYPPPPFTTIRKERRTFTTSAHPTIQQSFIPALRTLYRQPSVPSSIPDSNCLQSSEARIRRNPRTFLIRPWQPSHHIYPMQHLLTMCTPHYPSPLPHRSSATSPIP